MTEESKTVDESVDADFQTVTDRPDDSADLPDKFRQMILHAPADALDTAVKEFEYREMMMTKLLPMCMKQLRPADFQVFGDRAYLQEFGAQRVKGFLGLMLPNDRPPKRTRHELPDGEFYWIVEGWVGSKTLRAMDYFIGGRSSTEEFFSKKDEAGIRLPVKSLDVEKAAYTNWMNRVVSGLLGLRGITVADLETKFKFPLDQAARVTHQRGAKGGKTGWNTHCISQKFGPQESRGQAWSDMKLDHLKFWLKNAETTLADASQSQWHGRENTIKAAILMEFDSRGLDRKGEKKG